MSKSSQIIDNQFIIENFNNDFLLIKSAKGLTLSAFGKTIYEHDFPFVRQVIVTEKEICLQLNAHFKESDIELLKLLRESSKSASSIYEFPVYFAENWDWENVIAETGLSKDKIITDLTNQEFPVAMFGFLPGFVYLNGLDKKLHVPRKTVPSKYVEAGSIAIGGKYLGLYGLDSPGGWQVIGKMPISLLQIPHLPPMKINLGDKIRLRSVTKEDYAKLSEQNISVEDCRL
jgi:KipI family sensor histidine kinase inhibitor